MFDESPAAAAIGLSGTLRVRLCAANKYLSFLKEDKRNFEDKFRTYFAVRFYALIRGISTKSYKHLTFLSSVPR